MHWGSGVPAAYFFFAALGLLDEQEAFALFPVFLDMQGIAVTSLLDSPPSPRGPRTCSPSASASDGRRCIVRCGGTGGQGLMPPPAR